MPNESRMDRRQFAGTLAAGTSGAALSLAAQSVSADDQADKPQKDKDAKPEESVDAPAKPTMEILLLTFLMQRYPSEHYDETALQGIYGDIRGDLARGRILSEFPLKNSDEPAFVFQAYRRAE